MKKLLFILLAFWLAHPPEVMAQFDPVSRALIFYQNNDLLKAKEQIDLAIQDSTLSQQTRAWYFRGYIYKDLYKANRSTAEGRQYREVSADAFIHAIDIDEKKEFSEDSYQSLKYLASTLYNEAAIALDTNNFESSKSSYNAYRDLSKIATPGIDFTGRDIDFKLYMASKYSMIYDDPTIKEKPESIGENIVQLYKEVIALDSNNISANYNLAIHFYNQGVNIIENMNYEDDFEKLFEIQEKVITLFQQALPYMLKAYELDPKRKATLQGLSGIYYGLNDIEKSEKYQKELEELEKQEGSTNE